MQALIDLGLPVASSCGGKGVCGKCRISVSEKTSSRPLDRPTALELRLMQRFGLSAHERISCQVLLRGGEMLEVDADYW